MIVIVPDYVHDAITSALDRVLATLPDEERPKAEACRKHLYDGLLAHYNEHGTIPGFSITKRA